MLSGDPMTGLLMHIIRFVMPSKSKPLKKLLYLYYEGTFPAGNSTRV